MNGSLKKTVSKVLALLLAAAMALGVMPGVTLAEDGSGGETFAASVTFTVTDKANNPLSGASISCTLKAENTNTTLPNGTTDVSGLAEVDLSSYQSGIESGGASLSYTVTLDGYKSQKGTVDNLASGSNPVSVSLEAEAKTFTLMLTNGDEGTVKINDTEVKNGETETVTVTEGDSATISITPTGDYDVNSVTVDNNDITASLSRVDDRTVQLQLDIADNKEITVGYKAMETVTESGLYTFTENNLVRSDEKTGLYVYKKGATVTFSTTKDGICIGEPAKGGTQYKTQSVSVNETKEIKKIYIYYDNAWHVVNLNPVLNIVIDDIAPTIDLTFSNADGDDGYYIKDFSFNITAKDSGDYSGIASVEYWFTKDGTEGTHESVYTYNSEDKIEDEYKKEGIKVSAKDYDSESVILNVKVTDLAGNETTKTKTLYICTTAPTVTVEEDTANTTKNAEALDGNYTKRTIKVTFTDRSDVFDKDAAENAISIEGKDAEGNLVEIKKSGMISWTESGDTHTATISFTDDANYSWSIRSYTNKAGLSSEPIPADSNKSLYSFTVDNTAPTATITLERNSWNAIISVITFGIWKNKTMTTDINTQDATSGVNKDSICYYKTAGDTPLTKLDLEALYSEGKFQKEAYQAPEETSGANEKFVIYARVADNAGNYIYVSTDGAVYDATDGTITLTPGTPDYTAEDGTGIYTGDTTVSVKVDELAESGISSGISEIEWKVKSVFAGSSEAQTTQSKTESFSYSAPSYNDLTKTYDFDITVEAAKNNSDNVKVTVTVTDNAGNVYSKDISLYIATNNPAAKITFEDEEYNENRKDNTRFTKRSAVITVTDRSKTWKETAATEGIKITAVDSQGNAVELTEGSDYEIGVWTREAASGTDLYNYSAKIEFKKDGNYTLKFGYENIAEKSIEELTEVFTIDTTNPEGSVTVGKNTWDKLLGTLTFGLYSNKSLEVSAAATDATSPVSIEYYKAPDDTAIYREDLDELYKNGKFTEYSQAFSADPDEQFTVYIKITDDAGNYIYVSSDGNIVENKPSVVTLTPDQTKNYTAEEGEAGYYNGNVDVSISVNDQEPYSGIQKIEYWVESDADGDGKMTETQRQTLYSFEYERETTQDGKNTNGGTLTIRDFASGEEVVSEYEGNYPTKAQLKSSWSGKITVDSSLNNSSNTVVHVRATDNAGNVSEKELALDIDITAPTISISYDNNKDNGGNTYFDAVRTATVVITERTNHFEADKATAGITVTAKDVEGNDIADSYTISSWTTAEGGTPDEATHTAKISFKKDANYTLALTYTDKASNKNNGINRASGTTAAFKFTVDTTAPTGSVTASSAEGRTGTWESLLSSLTFGFWSRQNITVTSDQNDVTSPIASVQYYKVTSQSARDNTMSLSAERLDGISAWQPFAGIVAAANQQFTVYLKITDMAGNYTYLSTDGLIVDDQAPVEETVAPEITVTPQQPINDIYNGDVAVDIRVVDPMVGGTYSGLKTITYRVLNMGVETQSGTLYSFSNESPAQGDLLETWTGRVTVDSSLNNSNDVVIEVIAEDNSLNTSRRSESMKIDITAPTVDVSYSDNAPDSESYFKGDRTTTIVVTERNFNPDDVILTITNTDGVIPQLSGWSEQAGSGNGDDTRWVATLTYGSDGDYTFDMAYTDMAGNPCAAINYGDSAVPTAFTIDKTIPVISVTYDNNDVQNGNYYKADRVAYVTINEHNFNQERVLITMTATNDGDPATVPTVGGWVTNGNSHTATIYYSGNALYSFDIAFTDMAGNAAADFEQQTFYVDNEDPTIEISGVEDRHPYSGDVIPVISLWDTNFDSGNVSITLSGARRGAVELDGYYSDIHNGRVFTFNNFPEEEEVDDIYTLKVTLTDKSGRTSEKTVMFSVNRFGSVYTISDSTALLNGTYVKEAQDVVITETNANKLEGITITLFKNNETIILKEGEDYSVEVTGGDGQWYQYTYTIFAKNFEDDGVYRISISSKDEAGNVAENTLDTKNKEISFGVDKTAPTLVVTNLEDGKTYALTSLTVRMSANDNLLLNSVVVYLDGSDTPYRTWDADEIAEILAAGGEFTFEVPGDSTSAHNVRIVCMDAAGNEISQEISDFYVTTNLWVRYYNNKALFFGSIGGVAAAAGAGACVAVLLKRRKKKEA